jgi:AcrR family transcriptional regulator
VPARPSQRAAARANRAEVRTTILAAARAGLEQEAFAELSIDAVMERVGLTRTAFYRYFEDLGALVQLLLADVTRPLKEAAGRLAREAGEADEAAFLAALTEIVSVFAEHGRVIAATVAAAHHDAGIEQAVSATREHLTELTAAGIAVRARVTGVEITDPHETARALGAMNEGYLLDRFGRGQRVSVEQAVAALWPPWRQLLYRP